MVEGTLIVVLRLLWTCSNL